MQVLIYLAVIATLCLGVITICLVTLTTRILASEHEQKKEARFQANLKTSFPQSIHELDTMRVPVIPPRSRYYS